MIIDTPVAELVTQGYAAANAASASMVRTLNFIEDGRPAWAHLASVRALHRRGLINEPPPLTGVYRGEWALELTPLGEVVLRVVHGLDVPPYPADHCRSCGAEAVLIHIPQSPPGRRPRYRPPIFGTCERHPVASSETAP